jgi:hypothetical protein
MSVENDGGMILVEENQGTRRKNCPSATLSTTNPGLMSVVEVHKYFSQALISKTHHSS